jgi:predicted  nucleic acid-binding Zn-ribbon protein
MLRPTFLALSLLVFSPAALGQSTSTDPHTLQALLAEVRQLRHDLQTVSAAGQRAQILIYRAQAQDTVVRRVQERVEETRSKLDKIQSEKRRHAAQLKQMEDLQSRPGTAQSDGKPLEDALAQVRARLEMEDSDEQETQTRLTEAEDQLRVEQAKLDQLQDDLDRLDKALEDSSGKTGSAQQ